MTRLRVGGHVQHIQQQRDHNTRAQPLRPGNWLHCGRSVRMRGAPARPHGHVREARKRMSLRGVAAAPSQP
eukprot:scaffold4498_cov119-Isochrysis_galbana.AAC.13